MADPSQYSFSEADLPVTLARLAEYTKFTEADVKDLTQSGLSDVELQDIVRGYSEAYAIKDVSGWDLFLKIIAACVDIANVVVPIATAVSAVYGVAAVAKNLPKAS